MGKQLLSILLASIITIIIVMIVSWTLPWSLLVVGFSAWYLYYGLECFINGEKGPFSSLKQDFLINFSPNAWENRMATVEHLRKSIDNDSFTYIDMSFKDNYPENGTTEEKLEYIAKTGLPGKFHFMFTHVIIPFGPFAAYFLI